MPRANPIQVAWNAGELSPRMVARVDFAKYDNAASFVENLLAFPQGGLQRRGSTRYVATTKSSGQAILLPFQFSPDQAYIIEFGNLYARFYRLQGQIEDTGPVEVVTPYVTADLYELQITQSADTLYIVHPDYAPRTLTRTSHIAWTLAEIDFLDGPFLEANATTTTLTLSGTSGAITVTANAVTGINGGDGFVATDIGRLIRWKDAAGNWTWLEIDGVSTTTEIDATIRGPNASAGTGTANWRLGLWSDTTGYPATVTFFEERQIFAGSDTGPQRFDGSVPAEFTNFAPTEADGDVVDANAISYTIAADDQSRIRWLSPGTKLLIGTAGGEFIAESEGPILTPTDINVRRHTKIGCAPVMPLRVNNVTLFLQRSLRNLYEESFSFDQDGFVAVDLNLLAEHLTKTGIIQMAYQQKPDSVVWCVRSDGRLVAMTYKREQDVVGWTRHLIGGSFGSGNAVVESVAAIPGNDDAGQVYPSGDRDEVWLVVKRTIDGSTVRYVEVMEGQFEGVPREDYNTEAEFKAAMLEAQVDQFYVDSGLTYDGSANDTITGLAHLEGETVKVLADGAVHPECVVTSGEITLDYEASKVHVGLPCSWRWSSLKLAYGAAAGTAVGKIKRPHRVGFVLDSTGPFSQGSQLGALHDVEFRVVSDAMDTAVPLFTGEYVASFDSPHDRDPRIHLEGEHPCNFTLLAIAPEMVTRDVA